MIEREIKLTVADKSVLDAIADGAWLQQQVRCKDDQRIDMLARYYDTSAGDLTANATSLRVRRENQDLVLALKSRASMSVDGLSTSSELEQSIDAWPTHSDELPKGKIINELERLLKLPCELVWHVAVANQRRSFTFEAHNAIVQLVLDDVTIEVQDTQRRLYEVEIELISGATDALHKIAAELNTCHALWPSQMSKHQLGLQLWRLHDELKANEAMEASANLAIEQGVCSDARWIASPNFDERPDLKDISLLVIHNISLPPNEFGGDDVIKLFTNTLQATAHPSYGEIAELRVSSHFLIRRDGALLQFVNTDHRAWHAGQSNYCGREVCNDFAIGVELEGCDTVAFEDAQYATLVKLTHALLAYYPKLNTERITGHSDIAPGRKTDPGQAFDWQLYLGLL